MSGISPDYGTRDALYNLGSVPWNVFDGTIIPYEDTYESYLNAYNTRKAISSPLTVTVLSKSLTATHAYLKVRVTLESGVAAGKKVHLFLWEDDVTAGSHTWRFIERAGTTRDLTVTAAAQSQEFEHTFAVESGWKQPDLGFCVLVQDTNGTKEVLNACAAAFSDVGVRPASLGRVKASFQ